MDKLGKTGVTPALTLMILAPLLTEILPGATRFSSLFVLPIEICVWGGGAVLIRDAVRRWQLGWLNMLLLAIALAVAEECLIQQTSLAPLVIRLKGVTYARALGVNYVYLLWALIYEPVFVVLLPVYLAELIFPNHREVPWLGRAGLFVVIPLFFIGSCLAWFTWTHIARIKVFHMPVYHPPPATIVIAVAVICLLFYLAFITLKKVSLLKTTPLKPPGPWIPGIAGACWAALLYGLVLLAFGIDPHFPPSIAVGSGFLLVLVSLFLLPRWAADSGWLNTHRYALIFGVILGSMLAGQIGFIGTTGADLYFKVIVDIFAFILLILLGFRIRKNLTVYR